MTAFASKLRVVWLLAVLAGPTSVAAQTPGWHLSAEAAASHLGGGAEGMSDGDEITLRPHRPTLYAIRVERIGNRFGYGVALRYARPALGFEGTDVSIIDRGLPLTLYEVAPEVSVRVAGAAAGASLRARVGPVLDIWTWSAMDTQTRLGARAGLGLDLPLGRRFAATVGGAATLTGSMFAEDVAPEFEPRSAFRTEVGLGVRYAFR